MILVTLVGVTCTTTYLASSTRTPRRHTAKAGQSACVLSPPRFARTRTGPPTTAADLAFAETRRAQAIATDEARACTALPRPAGARGHQYAPTPMVLMSIQPVRVAPWTAPAVSTAGSTIAGAPSCRAVLSLTAPLSIQQTVRALPLTAKAVSTVFMEQRIG